MALFLMPLFATHDKAQQLSASIAGLESCKGLVVKTFGLMYV